MRVFQKWGLVVLLGVSNVSFASSAYKTVGPNGEVSYSSTPPQNSKVVSKVDIGGETALSTSRQNKLGRTFTCL